MIYLISKLRRNRRNIIIWVVELQKFNLPRNDWIWTPDEIKPRHLWILLYLWLESLDTLTTQNSWDIICTWNGGTNSWWWKKREFRKKAWFFLVVPIGAREWISTSFRAPARMDAANYGRTAMPALTLDASFVPQFGFTRIKRVWNFGTQPHMMAQKSLCTGFGDFVLMLVTSSASTCPQHSPNPWQRPFSGSVCYHLLLSYPLPSVIMWMVPYKTVSQCSQGAGHPKAWKFCRHNAGLCK